jgi:hypothetical protein
VDLARIQIYFWLAHPAISAFWAARLLHLRLSRRYRFLLAWLVLGSVLNLAGYAVYQYFGFTSDIYRWYFMVSRTAHSVLLLLILTEVYQRLMEGFAGLRHLGQLFGNGALAFSALIFLGSAVLPPGVGQRTLHDFWIMQERNIALSLTMISLGLVTLAVFFRLTPPRNVLVVLAVFGLTFAIDALMWALLERRGYDFSVVRDFVATISHVVLFLAGAMAFSKSGEQPRRPALAGAATAGADGQIPPHRLDSVNRVLVRVFGL